MRHFKAGLVLLIACVAVLCSWPWIKRNTVERQSLALLPMPQRSERLRGSFSLTPEMPLVADETSRITAEFLAEKLRKSTGYKFPVHTTANTQNEGLGVIIAQSQGNQELGPEGYKLSVLPEIVKLEAPTSAGLFYGAQTLLQLLPPQIFADRPIQNVRWKTPCVRIEDNPRFSWRGLMLDVSRHFFKTNEIKQLLDAMALHKLNTFHWHLTDDQGWRIEIKKYQKLTQVGAWRKKIGFNLDFKSSNGYGPDPRYGGYYTQNDIREILAYAEARHITIVPEIEMPGHATAALAAYPELSCSGGPYSTDVAENTSEGVFCAGKEETFDFLKNVLQEVIELFPSQYIHIGGDEVSIQNWKACPQCQSRIRAEGLKSEGDLQSYFIRRINKIIAAHGRTLIGWSEIRQGGLPSGAAIMDWIGGAVEAASSGHDVVMCPEAYCYFDFYQSKDRTLEPAAAGAFLPLEKVYSFEPIPADLPPDFDAHILGAQANVWTEYIPSLSQVEYMTFPRLCALAEVVWSPKATRNWNDFNRRLGVHLQRLQRSGIKYRRPD